MKTSSLVLVLACILEDGFVGAETPSIGAETPSSKVGGEIQIREDKTITTINYYGGNTKVNANISDKRLENHSNHKNVVFPPTDE